MRGKPKGTTGVFAKLLNHKQNGWFKFEAHNACTKSPVDGLVKQNEIRQRLGTFKIPSGTQSSSHDTKLAFTARSNYREKKLTALSVLQLYLPLKPGTLSLSAPHTLTHTLRTHLATPSHSHIHLHICSFALWLLVSCYQIRTISNLSPLSSYAHMHVPAIPLWHQFYELLSRKQSKIWEVGKGGGMGGIRVNKWQASRRGGENSFYALCAKPRLLIHGFSLWSLMHSEQYRVTLP